MNYKLFTVLAALAIIGASCTNNDPAVVETWHAASQNPHKITLTASMPDSGDATRLALAETAEGNILVKWKAGDKINLCFVSGSTVKTVSNISVTNISEDGKKADFAVNVPAGITEPYDLYGVYGAAFNGADTKEILFPAAPAGAALTDSEPLCVMRFAATNLTNASPLSVTFSHLGAILGVWLTNSTATDYTLTSFSITSSGYNWLYNASGQAVYDIATGTFTDSKAGDALNFPAMSISVSANTSAKIYRWFVPTNSPDNTKTMTVTLNSTAMAQTIPAKAFEKGKYYRLGLVWDGATWNRKTIYYVDASKPDNSGDGLSWATAKRDVQDAINLAATGSQVWVKAGTYKPTRHPDNNSDANPADRNNAFLLKDGVAVYGGFTGTETALNQRNWTTNVTTLSGNNNTYHVVVSSGVSAATVFDGFTITGGKADGNGTTITVNGNVFYNNRGGGMYQILSSPIISNCIVTGNTAYKYGGLLEMQSSSQITSCTFSSNTSNDFSGGVALIDGSKTVMKNCAITGNRSYNAGGGGIAVADAGSSPLIINCIIKGNNASWGSGIHPVNSATPTFINCLIAENKDAIDNYRASPTFINCTIARNSSLVLYDNQGTSQLRNCIIWGNGSGISGSPNITYSDVQGGRSGTGNINADPLFVDAANGNYRLQATSPAVNVGNNADYNTAAYGDKDLAGNTRISGSVIDMGAYEFGSTP